MRISRRLAPEWALVAGCLCLLAIVARDAQRAHVGASLAVFGVGCLLVGIGLVGAWLMGDRNLRRELLRPRWMKRRHEAFWFLPRPTPPGWTEAFSPFHLPHWFAYTRDEAIMSWVKPYDVGYCLHVGLGPDSPTDGPLSEERAAELLGEFRSPTPFIELSPGGEPWVPDNWPGGRMWMAPAGELWSSPPPRSVAKPALLDHPVDEHLAATRMHLPAKLPICWWPPLPIAAAPGAWKRGAWLLGEGNTCLLVSRVSLRSGTKLAVLVFRLDGSRIGVGCAHSALGELRGVRAFVQVWSDDRFPGSRLFLGEIEPMADPVVLN